MSQADQLREQGYNLRVNSARTSYSYTERQRAQQQAQQMLAQAEQIYTQARDLQKQLEAAGAQVDQLPPPAGSVLRQGAEMGGLQGAGPTDEEVRRQNSVNYPNRYQGQDER